MKSTELKKEDKTLDFEKEKKKQASKWLLSLYVMQCFSDVNFKLQFKVQKYLILIK